MSPKTSHPRFRRAVLAACAAALATVGALGTAPAQAASSPAAGADHQSGSPLGVLTEHREQVPASALPSATKAAMRAAHLTVTPNSAYTVVELVSAAYGKCVDANDYGSTAGQNGDVVQLWTCLGTSANHPNQWWLAAQTNDGTTELINVQYGLCLDANSFYGFADGARVQLWQCYGDQTNHPNQWWDFGPDGSYTALPVLWGGYSKVLDVNDYGPTAGQNGDTIQIWGYLGGANQSWLQ